MKKNIPFISLSLLGLGAILSFFFLDRSSLVFFEPFSQNYKKFFTLLSFLSSDKVNLILWFMAFVICRFIVRNIRLAPIFFEFVVAVFFAEAFIYFFKCILGRARPLLYLSEHKFGFYFFKFSDNYHSFPSGHGTTAFLVATLASFYLPRFRFYIFGVAILTAFSRVFLLQHYISDIVGSAIFAYLIGYGIHWSFQKINKHI